MAPPKRRPAPPVQLRVLLAGAKRRGLPFDEAWDEALRGVVWPHDTTHRRQWREAARRTREEWRACYEDRPTPLAKTYASLPPHLLEHEGEGGAGVDRAYA